MLRVGALDGVWRVLSDEEWAGRRLGLMPGVGVSMGELSLTVFMSVPPSFRPTQRKARVTGIICNASGEAPPLASALSPLKYKMDSGAYEMKLALDHGGGGGGDHTRTFRHEDTCCRHMHTCTHTVHVLDQRLYAHTVHTCTHTQLCFHRWVLPAIHGTKH